MATRRSDDAGRSRVESIQGNPDAIVGDPEDLVSTDWSDKWNPDGGFEDPDD
ncbi:hypothetical protein RE9425_03140 [Prescottella equi]|nr:hypothetical protein RE9425_03140 [Prescottella equi]